MVEIYYKRPIISARYREDKSLFLETGNGIEFQHKEKKFKILLGMLAWSCYSESAGVASTGGRMLQEISLYRIIGRRNYRIFELIKVVIKDDKFGLLSIILGLLDFLRCRSVLHIFNYLSLELLNDQNAYGACQTACNIGWVSCYATFGYVAGTVTAGAGTPLVILGCNAAQGACTVLCAPLLVAPTP
ncbi:11490_t:CDS:2 [Dentiscutata erythropus]|uniref:11490_t:CDS:1 n=1 Tax=Dentiscutata erythropus TaxID=1348616 RepID=A0A9N9P284_9GLOM|nr:11490_t:CDS:2 [Dentiscutata erythropus]